MLCKGRGIRCKSFPYEQRVRYLGHFFVSTKHSSKLGLFHPRLRIVWRYTDSRTLDMDTMEETSVFDKLPDELIFKIIKLVLQNYQPVKPERHVWWTWTSPHDFLVTTIANISTRFKRLALDNSLWSGNNVFVSGHDAIRVKRLIKDLLPYFQMTSLSVKTLYGAHGGNVWRTEKYTLINNSLTPSQSIYTLPKYGELPCAPCRPCALRALATMQ